MRIKLPAVTILSLFLTACPDNKKKAETSESPAIDTDTSTHTGTATNSQNPAGAQGPKGGDGFNSLLAMTAEPMGSHCEFGGQKIESGLDNGANSGVARNGVLESGEIQATSYVCAQQSVPPRLLRVTASSAVTLSATEVDSACAAEFGDSYKGATRLDTLFHLSNIMTHPYGVFAVDGSVSVYNSGSYDNYAIWTISATTARAACVYVKAPVRFTRGTFPAGATTAQTNALCQSEFGTTYHLAHMWDVFANKPPRIDFGGIYTADGHMSIEQQNQYGKYALGQFGTGTYPVACAAD